MTDKNKQEVRLLDKIQKGECTAKVIDFIDNDGELFAELDNGFIKFKVNEKVLNEFVIIERAKQ